MPRFHSPTSPTSSGTPAPGAYNVRSRVLNKKSFGKSSIFQGPERKFSSSSSGEVRSGTSTPGPGAYSSPSSFERVTATRKQLMLSLSPSSQQQQQQSRFVDITQSSNPAVGPGSYEVAGSLIKKTYNSYVEPTILQRTAKT